MKLKFLRQVAFFLLLTFSFHQLSFASPISLPIANIEDRHFLVVTQITGQCTTPTDSCTVTFLENGYTRTKSAAEFSSKWFGVVLVDQAVKTDTRLTIYDSQILKTSDLLKVKGAGWFKKLFKKIARFFQAVAKAVAKVLQKIVSAVTRALTTVFGRTIGGALASLVLGPVQFLANTAYYIGQGDFKGLMKYWGQVLIQIAIQAVVAVIAPYLLGPLMGFLGGILQGVGGFLSAAGGFLANAIPILGNLIGGVLNAAGNFLTQVGTQLIRYGTSLMNQSNQFFSDLKTKGFSFIKDSLKTGFSSFINQLNPVTGYQSLFKSVTAGVIESASGFTRLLTNVAEKLGVQIALQKIDQSLEKSKLNSFTKALLSTVASVGIQALGSSLSEGFGSIQGSGSIEAAGARAPPTGLAGFFSQIGSALSSVGGIITNGLKDAGGFIKSLFVQNQDGLSPNAKITFNNNGEVNYYDSLDDLLDLQYSVDPLSSSVSRSDLDGGGYQYLGFDPNTNAVTSNERVGNLEGVSDYNQLFWSDFLGQTGHDLWNVASLGTLAKVDAIMAEYPNASTAELLGRSLWAGFSSVSNAITLGYSDAIYNAQMSQGPGLGSILNGVGTNTRNLLPFDDFGRALNSNLSLADRTEGFFSGISKSAALVGVLAGVRTNASSAVVRNASQTFGIKTPYGIATQDFSPSALAARSVVGKGATLYKVGTIGRSEAIESQFWALEPPWSQGFGGRYGIPAKNLRNLDFVEVGTLKPGTRFVTRPAPGIGSNRGGAIEVVVPNNGVEVKLFRYLGRRSQNRNDFF